MSRIGETAKSPQNEALKAMSENIGRVDMPSRTSKASGTRTSKARRRAAVSSAETPRRRSTRWLAMSYAFRSLFSRGITRTPYGEHKSASPTENRDANILVGLIMRRGANAKRILPALQNIADAHGSRDDSSSHGEHVEGALKEITGKMSDMQLYRLHRKIEGGQLENLRGALSFAGRDQRLPNLAGKTPQETALVQRQMADMGRKLNKLNEFALTELTARGYDVQQKAEGYIGSEEKIRRRNLAVMEGVAALSSARRAAGGGKISDPALMEAHGAFLTKKDDPIRLRDQETIPSAFSTGIRNGECSVSFGRRGDTRLDRDDDSALHKSVLLEQCDGNAKQAARLASLLTSSVGRNLMSSAAASRDILLETGEGNIRLPLGAGMTNVGLLTRENGRHRFSVSRDSKGAMRVNLVSRAPVRGSLSLDGVGHMALDNRQSIVEHRFSFVVPADGGELVRLGDKIDYDYVLTLNRGDDLQPLISRSVGARRGAPPAPPSVRVETPV